MSMKDWAKHEIELACKRENPDWDGKSFDYGCACYQSALKAYECLMEDGHSGMSFNFTKYILIRLMNGLPLTPITDEDFEDVEPYDNRNGIVTKQCPRMGSLLRKEDANGNVSYTDVDRQYGVDVNDDSVNYSSRNITDIIDEMFPITMPYCPTIRRYEVYVETFLTDEKKGDFDTKGILYCITPDNKKVEINRFFADTGNEWCEITEEEYNIRKKNKL